MQHLSQTTTAWSWWLVSSYPRSGVSEPQSSFMASPSEDPPASVVPASSAPSDSADSPLAPLLLESVRHVVQQEIRSALAGVFPASSAASHAAASSSGPVTSLSSVGKSHGCGMSRSPHHCRHDMTGGSQ